MRLVNADALIQSLEKKHAHWHELVTEENKEIEYAHQYAVNVIRNAPSAEPTGDLISREDAIKAVAIAALDDRDELEAIKALPSADAVQGNCIPIELKKRYPHSRDEDITDAFMRGYQAHAEAVQGWIPCSERLPEDLEAVNVTWVNHNPPVYYQYTKDVPNADTAVYYRGVWYWWDSTICDVLGEYGEKCGAEQIDKDIEILAWMPLPKPYKGGDEK